VPRMARVVVPKYPHSVVERGHNRQVVIAELADFEYHLEMLAEFKAEYAVPACGFCLMTNHVHLVLQPGERVVGLGQLMKGLPHRSQGRPRMESENKSVPFFDDLNAKDCIVVAVLIWSPLATAAPPCSSFGCRAWRR